MADRITIVNVLVTSLYAAVLNRPDNVSTGPQLGINHCRSAPSTIALAVINSLYFMHSLGTSEPLLLHCQCLMIWVRSATTMASTRIVFARVPHICWLQILAVIVAGEANLS